jgi:protein-S-isoprenylcysteine O-methyltransferase Ste14
MIVEFQNIIQIATLCCLAAMGIRRAIVLKSQKTQVLVLDSQLTKTQFLNGIFFVTCFIVWIFESFSYGLSFNHHIPVAILEILIVQHIGFILFGTIVMVCGLAIYAMALYSFRNSWRIGIDRENPGQLVTSGVFRYSRNPIYLSLDLLVFGTFLLQGRLVFLLLFICISASLHIQILHEEQFLIQTYGDSYSRYRSNVGRYINIKPLLR